MGEGQKIRLVLVCIIFLNQVCWTGGEEISVNTAHVRVNELKTAAYRGSTYQSACVDECSYDESNLYYWCNTDNGLDYCSPAPDVTSKNEACRWDHRCDTHGYSYTWCRTESGWDYCGLVQTSALYEGSRRQKRQPDDDLVEICSETDKGNNKKTKILAEPNPMAIADVGNFRNEVVNLISRWNNGYLGNQARSQLITSDNFRIDLQGFVNRNNQRYYNLQIQKNVPRQHGASTTVSQVLMSQHEDVPDRYVRRAFTESFRRRARVFVDVIYGNFRIRRGQNCG